MSKPFYRWQPGEPFGLPPHRGEEHWNPLVGCDHGAMLGCLPRCWARQMVERLGDGWDVGSDFRPRLVKKWLNKPLSWHEPRLVPTGFMVDIACLPRGDVGHVLDVIDATPRHRYLLLTKDPQRLAPALSHWSNYHGGMGIPFNAWLGATVRNQGDADRVIPALLRAPAAHYWLSVEPLLGPINIAEWLEMRDPYEAGIIDEDGNPDHSCDRCGGDGFMEYYDCPESWEEDCPSEKNHLVECPECHGDGMNDAWRRLTQKKVSWVVVGAESGRGARWGSAICAAGQSGRCPLDNRMADDRDCRKCRRAEWKVVDWTRSLVAQCRDAGVPCLVKQLPEACGAHWVVSSDPADFPQDLRAGGEMPVRHPTS